MKPLSFGLILIAFATVFLLSSALPGDNEKDHRSNLIKSAESKETSKSLQRRKPPGKIPGPKLTSGEQNSEFLAGIPRDKESKMKHLSGEDERKKGKKDANLKKYNKNRNSGDLTPSDDGDSENKEKSRNKEKNLTRREGHNSGWKEDIRGNSRRKKQPSLIYWKHNAKHTISDRLLVVPDGYEK